MNWPNSSISHRVHRTKWEWLKIFGPGILVMLADTDAGSVVTAAQSGAKYGNAFVLPDIFLIVVLYLVQEMTVRMGLATGQGQGALIRKYFGVNWARAVVLILYINCVGALVTEYAGIATVGQLAGISKWWFVPMTLVILVAAAFLGKYRRVERMGIMLGLLEIVFIPAAIWEVFHGPQSVSSLWNLPLGQTHFAWMVAANVGAVLMPWMIFFQQQAVHDSKMGVRHLKLARRDTLFGAILTQSVMIAVMMTAAAVFPRHMTLTSMSSLALTLVPLLGRGGVIIFGAGLLGASMVAALVVSLAGSWAMAEVFDWKHSLNSRFQDTPTFHMVYALSHVIAVCIVLTTTAYVSISIAVEVMNAAILPAVLVFLIMLEYRALPRAWRMSKNRRILIVILSALAVLSGLLTL